MNTLSSEDIKALCSVIANTEKGLTKSELSHHLRNSNIILVNDGKNSASWGLSKKNWLYNCIANEVNNANNVNKFIVFIEKVLNPVNYTDENDRAKYNYLLTETNKILLLIGYKVNDVGRLIKAIKATSLNEVDRRVDSLNAKLYSRSIHSEVKKYCIKDYLRRDYYDAVFEASKGLAERVREITGLNTDGSELFDAAFSVKSPRVIMNTLESKTERSEYNGLKELLNSIFHLVRNPVAHTPKINWKEDEIYALDVLVLISFAHKYLDKCYSFPT